MCLTCLLCGIHSYYGNRCAATWSSSWCVCSTVVAVASTTWYKNKACPIAAVAAVAVVTHRVDHVYNKWSRNMDNNWRITAAFRYVVRETELYDVMLNYLFVCGYCSALHRTVHHVPFHCLLRRVNTSFFCSPPPFCLKTSWTCFVVLRTVLTVICRGCQVCAVCYCRRCLLSAYLPLCV